MMISREDLDLRQLQVERSTATAHKLTHYDGACHNMHGHNMEWDVTLTVSMDDVGEDNMPLDLKEVANTLDIVDHATVLNKEDILVEKLLGRDHETFTMEESGDFHEEIDIPGLGPTFLFNGDPTCEVLAQWMAETLLKLNGVIEVEVTVNETSKYGLSASAYQ